MAFILVCWAAITKNHRLGGLNKKKFICSQFWGLGDQGQDVSGSGFSEWLADGLLTISFLCIHASPVSFCGPNFLFFKDTI